MKRLLLFVVLAAQFNSNAQCTPGNGVETTENVTVSIFDGVETGIGIDTLFIQEGVFEPVVLEGDANVVENIVLTTTQNTLNISFPSDSCYIDYSLNIKITVPDLANIDFSGSGFVLVGDFTTASSLSLLNSGSGDIEVGAFTAATTFAPEISGSGSIFMTTNLPNLVSYHVSNVGAGVYSGCALLVDSCFVDSYGIGLVSVHAETYLDIDLFGSGDVEYYGSPTVNEENFGSGISNNVSASGCGGTLGLVEQTQNEIRLFPNPSKGGSVQLTFENTLDVGVTIYSVNGSVVYANDRVDTNLNLDLNITPGLYIVDVRSSGTHEQLKWIVE